MALGTCCAAAGHHRQSKCWNRCSILHTSAYTLSIFCGILSDGPKSQLLLCFRPSLLTNLKDLPSARLHCQSCNVALSWSVCDSLGQGWLGMLLRTDCKLVVQRCLPGIFDSKFGRVCKSFPGIFFEDVAPEVKVARQKPLTIDHQPVA